MPKTIPFSLVAFKLSLINHFFIDKSIILLSACLYSEHLKWPLTIHENLV
jgi:hypothetical protein